MNILFTCDFIHLIHCVFTRSLSPCDVTEMQKLGTHLYPLLPVYLHTVGAQRGDGSVDNLLHHLSIAIGFL